ncbi:hypothetical protein [Flavobacterium sp. ZT3R18]|nr:hypothetical protein [Flavobacterium sp. ZT3R18]
MEIKRLNTLELEIPFGYKNYQSPEKNLNCTTGGNRFSQKLALEIYCN